MICKRASTKKEFVNHPHYLIYRLIAGVDESLDSDCWDWGKSKNDAGYGRINVNGKIEYTHRMAYRLHKGEIPKGIDQRQLYFPLNDNYNSPRFAPACFMI